MNGSSSPPPSGYNTNLYSALWRRFKDLTAFLLCLQTLLFICFSISGIETLHLSCITWEVQILTIGLTLAVLSGSHRATVYLCQYTSIFVCSLHTVSTVTPASTKLVVSVMKIRLLVSFKEVVSTLCSVTPWNIYFLSWYSSVVSTSHGKIASSSKAGYRPYLPEGLM